MDKIIHTEDRQSIFDISIQEYGNAELYFDLLLKNNLTDITEDITNRKLIIPQIPEIDEKKINRDVLKILDNKKIATLSIENK